MPAHPLTTAASPARGRLRGVVAVAVIAASLAGAWQMQRLIVAHQQARFDYEVQRIESAVTQRMGAYVQVLRGGLGLLAVGGDVTLAQWLRYVEQLQLSARYPGFKSLSFAAAVTPAELPALVQKIRSGPLPPEITNTKLLSEFTLRAPAGTPGGIAVPLPLRAPIVFVAPMIPSNERVLGVDMMQEPQRRTAMQRAMTSGMAELSPRLQLSGQGDRKAGFIAYLAVQPTGELRGWLTAAFLAEDFMRGLLGVDARALDFEVYDGPDPQPAGLLYSTAGTAADGSPIPLPSIDSPLPILQRQLPLPGRDWTLRYRAAPAFVPSTDQIAPWLVVLGGLLAAALFYFTARSGARLSTALDLVASQNQQLTAQVQERLRAESEARHQATHDALTGLANRHLFIDRLNHAIHGDQRRSESFALAYLDIDGFKAINDTHGHQAGDALLQSVAMRLQSMLRSEDTLARLGGDEFAIVFEQAVDAADLQRLCVLLIDDLRNPFRLCVADGATEVRISASVGLAFYPQHGSDCDALIGSADAAMYRAKRNGKNRCVLASSD